MNFLSLVGVELKKIRRSKILLILLIPVIMMWIPSIINADMNFDLDVYKRQHPQMAIQFLSSLKDDESEYVRKSIGNALKDISKKYPGKSGIY